MLRFIGVICDRTAPPLRAGACGSAGREFAMLRAWRGDHPPAALGRTRRRRHSTNAAKMADVLLRPPTNSSNARASLRVDVAEPQATMGRWHTPHL